MTEQPTQHLNPWSGNEAIISYELESQEEIAQFAETLDSEQKAAFDKITSPLGQIQLKQEWLDTDSSPLILKFGLFPSEENMTPIQLSVYTLIAADTADKQAQAYPEDSAAEKEYTNEANRLRELAKKFRQQPDY